MDDSINRQSALDALDKRFESFIKQFGYDSYERADEKTKLVCDGLSEAENVIMGLPSAQPEIVWCKDCKHFIREDIEEYTPYGFYNTYFHAFCDKHWDREQGEYIDVKLDDFCSFAERRKK